MFTTEEGAHRYQAALVPLMFASSARLLVANAKLQPGAQVLDVATGTGVVARAAAAAIRRAGHVTAVDPAAAMLAVARLQPAPAESAPIDYIESTIEDAALPAAAFDAAFCQQGLQFFEEPGKTLNRIREALRPEGSLHVALWRSEEEHPLTLAMQRALMECGLEAFTGFLSKVHHLHNPALVNGLLRQGGFMVERQDSVEIVPDGRWHASDGRRLLAATPLAAKLDALPPEKRAELEDACERQLDTFAKNGQLDLRFPATFYTARPA